MPTAAKLVVPIALGLSLVTVTAFVVYYVFKKEEEKDEKSVATSRTNVIEVKVPKSVVPALIGRNGSNIKEIEHKSGAKINFKKFSDKDHDICVIRGESHTSQAAENLVRDFMKQQPVIVEDTLLVPNWACGRIIGEILDSKTTAQEFHRVRKFMKQLPVIVEDTLLVPNWACGRMIGTGGESINDISHRSGARVKVEGGPGRDGAAERHVSFRGTREQIDVAKTLVQNCVAAEKCRREIEQSKRSPRHTQPAVASAADSPGDPKRIKYKRPEVASASIEVYVSAVSSPSRFWVQFVGPQVAQLDELVEQMTRYYGEKTNREAHALTQVSVGQVVAAVFRHDGRWYRARVHDIRPNEFDATKQVADVFYLDYGDSEYVATNELCELRADLLRLRFQAMECFLAGVKPAGPEEETVRVTPAGQRWQHWPAPAVERFEALTQVARWKPLVSKTCSYRKTATEDGQKEKEIPGIKLYDVTEEGELDIGAVLMAEGFAVAAPPSPRASPPRAPATPFGDLGNSRVLGMVEGRASSMPKDHKDDQPSPAAAPTPANGLPSYKSLTGLEQHTPIAVSNFDLHPESTNGANFLDTERRLQDEGSSETLVPSPNLSKLNLDEFKANINRIDSHHGNLEALGRMHEL